MIDVWRALADPTRRRILDLLRDGPRTTGQLAEAFEVTRFAVMKHLSTLEDAGLVVVRRRGRERWNHLNLLPLRQAYERFSRPQADRWATVLMQLKAHTEGTDHMTTVSGSLAIEPLEIEQETKIDAPRERVFDGLLQIEAWWPHRYQENAAVHLEERVGGRFWEEWDDGNGALHATLIAMRRPEFLRFSGPMGMTGAVVAVWEVRLEPAEEGTLLRLSHRAFGEIDDGTRQAYAEGWGKVLEALRAHIA